MSWPKPRRGSANAGERRERPVVDLPRVRLADHVVRAGESEALGEALVEAIHLRPVPVEQFEERRFRPCRPPRAPEAEFRPHRFDLLEVEEEVLKPEAGPLPDRHGLGRLQVRVAERGLGGLLTGECREVFDRPQQRSRTMSSP